MSSHSPFYSCFKTGRQRIPWGRTGLGLEWCYCWQLINSHFRAKKVIPAVATAEWDKQWFSRTALALDSGLSWPVWPEVERTVDMENSLTEMCRTSQFSCSSYLLPQPVLFGEWAISTSSVNLPPYFSKGHKLGQKGKQVKALCFLEGGLL